MIGFIKKAIGMSGLFRSPKRANELIDERNNEINRWNV